MHQDFKRLEGGLKFPRILFDEDGPPFLHVLAKLEDLNEAGEPTIDFLNSPEVIDAQLCQRQIQSALDASIYEPAHYEKLRWLALYWNGTVANRRGALEPIHLPVMHNLEK